MRIVSGSIPTAMQDGLVVLSFGVVQYQALRAVLVHNADAARASKNSNSLAEPYMPH